MFGSDVKLEKFIERSYEKEKKREKSAKNPIKRKAGKALAGFFAMILLLTVISRAADSMTVAKVKTTKLTSTVLNYVTSGTGSVVAGSKKYLYVESGICIEKLLVKQGQTVEADDEILKFSIEDIKKKLDEAKKELKKLELAYRDKQLEIQGQTYLSGTDGTASDVDFAKKDLEDAKEKYEEAKAKYENAKMKSGTDLIEDKTEVYEKAKRDYEQERLAYESSIKKADWLVEDAEKKLADSRKKFDELKEKINCYADFAIAQDSKNKNDALNSIYYIAYGNKEEYEKYQEEYTDALLQLSNAISSGSDTFAASLNLSRVTKKEDSIKKALDEYVALKRNDEELAKTKIEETMKNVLGETEYKRLVDEIADNELALEREKKDYELQKQKLDISLNVAKEAMSKAEKELDAVKNGTYDIENELESYRMAMEAAEDQVVSCERALEKAVEAANTEQERTSAEQAKAKIDQERNALALEAAEINMEEKREDVDKLETMLECDGIIKTEIGGIIEKIDVEEGKTAAEDVPAVTLSTGGFSFEGYVPIKEAERISAEDECTVRLNGSNEIIDTKIEFVERGIDNAKITASLPEGSYVVGTNGKFTIERSSELFNNCIPLSAIRNDSMGKFVLVISEKESILGKETVAKRVSVNVIDNDSFNAAIESSLSPNDKVIDQSSKDITDGDRVRIIM